MRKILHLNPYPTSAAEGEWCTQVGAPVLAQTWVKNKSELVPPISLGLLTFGGRDGTRGFRIASVGDFADSPHVN